MVLNPCLDVAQSNQSRKFVCSASSILEITTLDSKYCRPYPEIFDFVLWLVVYRSQLFEGAFVLVDRRLVLLFELLRVGRVVIKFLLQTVLSETAERDCQPQLLQCKSLPELTLRLVAWPKFSSNPVPPFRNRKWDC